LEPFKPAIDAMLREDLAAPRKQRHTARRVLARLVDEHGATELSYSTVRDYVARRRRQIAAEAGQVVGEAFVPQTHEPAAEAEVDFADLWVVLRGVKTKTFLFTLRLSYSGKAVHRAFATQGQEAFLEGHVYAFAQLGGVPTVKIRYDNLKAIVSRVLMGRTREESQRWIAFRSHYGFDAFYCQPGPDGAHEKGGVEGEGGRFRRTHCVPMPVVDSIDELNELLAAADAKDDHRRIANRAMTVGHDFAVEQPLLRPLPAEPFPTWLTLTPRVDRYARITVRCSHYSVPARLIGRRVRVQLNASQLVVFDNRTVVATHPRSTVKGSQSLVLDHYLEVLMRKPGALPGATALAQARGTGMFTATHEAFWAAARKAHGDAGGTRALVEVLLLHRHLDHADVLAGITAALTLDSTSPDVVAVEARKAAQQRGVELLSGSVALARPRVVSLTQRRLAELPVDQRPLPSVEHYDQLLTRESS
jgi:transposase